MQPGYRFLDRWLVDAPIERVYEVIGDVLGYQREWTDFVICAEGDAGEPRPGKKNRLVVKACLPYKVRFGLEVIEAERPRVNHALIKYQTPVLRPLFRSNHVWAMKRGERQLRQHRSER